MDGCVSIMLDDVSFVVTTYQLLSLHSILIIIINQAGSLCPTSSLCSPPCHCDLAIVSSPLVFSA